MSNRFCLKCDDGTILDYQARDMQFIYKGNTLLIKAIKGWHCPVCRDCFFDPGEGQRHSQAIDIFTSQIDCTATDTT